MAEEKDVKNAKAAEKQPPPGQAVSEAAHARNETRRAAEKEKPAGENAPEDIQPDEEQDHGVVAEKVIEGKANEASNQFTDADGNVIDATPEGEREFLAAPVEKKAPPNPYTKAYKADFPSRNESLQNAVALAPPEKK
jgi:hypothetical protein